MTQLNRRMFLGLSAMSAGALLLGANGCTSLSSGEMQADEGIALLREAVDAAAENPVVAVDEQTLIDHMAQAANDFLAVLDEPQQVQTTYAFADAERFRWHWTTPRSFPRNGLPLREMAEEQKMQALTLLQTSLSAAGLAKALDIMSLQRDLGNDPELYYVTIFGTPGAAEPWGWRWEGHHLSHHFTISGGQLATTPIFLGSWPTTSESGLRAMPREEDAALELVNSLSESARNAAIFQARTVTQHVTRNAAEVSPLEPIGLLYGDMTDSQQKLVNEIIKSYLDTQPNHMAVSGFARIDEAGIEQIRFAWAGSLEKRNPQYYRLQGPTFLLEFDNSRNGGTHIHSVWRDFERDFGYHLLS